MQDQAHLSPTCGSTAHHLILPTGQLCTINSHDEHAHGRRGRGNALVRLGDGRQAGFEPSCWHRDTCCCCWTCTAQVTIMPTFIETLMLCSETLWKHCYSAGPGTPAVTAGPAQYGRFIYAQLHRDTHSLQETMGQSHMVKTMGRSAPWLIAGGGGLGTD